MPGCLWWDGLGLDWVGFYCFGSLPLVKKSSATQDKLQLRPLSFFLNVPPLVTRLNFLPFALGDTMWFSHLWTGSVDCDPKFLTGLN